MTPGAGTGGTVPDDVLRAVHRESGRTIAAPLIVARTFTSRARGWIGRRPAPGEGLWLPRCACIHTCGLHIAIDAVWCGPGDVIVRINRSVRPWRIAAAKGAENVCEIAAGGAIGLAPGDHLDLVAGQTGEPRFCYH